MNRLLRMAMFSVMALLMAFGVGCVLHAPVCYPFDYMWNIGGPVVADDLRAKDDDKVRVVFLQHGMWRTSMALDRLERTLAAHGYEVVNVGYPSTEDYIEGHALRLRDTVEARLKRGKVDEVAFAGHSMGGLVIHEYLRRPDRRTPTACVYIATPQRGAILADKRRHWFLFEMVMGTKSASQLATTDDLHRRAIPFGAQSGTIVGDIGVGNGAIPGRDDGTVGVNEATFDGAAASVTVPFGHTRIVVADQTLRQVLHFLKKGAFAE